MGMASGEVDMYFGTDVGKWGCQRRRKFFFWPAEGGIFFFYPWVRVFAWHPFVRACLL